MLGRLPLGSRILGVRWVMPWMLRRLGHRAERLLGRRATETVRRGERHLLVALCDHFEPLHGMASLERGLARVQSWRGRYPLLAGAYRDDDGRPPRHTFFYPAEQYRPELVEPLAELCEAGLGEVEVHIHHDGETRDGMERWIERTVAHWSEHGLMTRSPDGRPRWAFIHGNWALANARADGRHCGVDDELAVLFETGCYADFTFPAAPDPCQPAVANALWYPRGDPGRRRAHERAVLACVGGAQRDRLLLVSGPLAITRRPGSRRPRIDAAAITAGDPATPERLRDWLACDVHVVGRPEWVFVKLHTHGAPEPQADALLGRPQRGFHEALAALRDAGDRVHYVTAREMYNIAMAAMDGKEGDAGAYRDYEVPPPPRAAAAAQGCAASRVGAEPAPAAIG